MSVCYAQLSFSALQVHRQGSHLFACGLKNSWFSIHPFFCVFGCLEAPTRQLFLLHKHFCLGVKGSLCSESRLAPPSTYVSTSEVCSIDLMLAL